MNFDEEIKKLEYLRDNVLSNHGAAVGEINQVVAKLREASTPGVPQGAPKSSVPEAKAPEAPVEVPEPEIVAHSESKHKKKSK